METELKDKMLFIRTLRKKKHSLVAIIFFFIEL